MQRLKNIVRGMHAIPIVLIALLLEAAAALLTKVGLLKGTVDRSASEVERYLSDFLDGTGSKWDWDDFVSVPITDPAFDRIREEASIVALPVCAEGEAIFRRLVDEARALS